MLLLIYGRQSKKFYLLVRVCVCTHVSGGCLGAPCSDPDPIGYDAQRAAGILNENAPPPARVTQQVFQHSTYKCHLFIRGLARVGACVYGGKHVLFCISNDPLCVRDLVTSTRRAQIKSCKRRHC